MVVLAGLLGITSWVVASVSTWLVPVYVTAMVFIFVSPRVESPEGSRGAAGPSGSAAGEEPAKGAQGPPSTAPPPSRGAEPLAGDPPEAPAKGSSPSTPGSATTAKPRRRSRARKPAKPGSEPAAAAPATWIRVGPGKFVRADLHAQAAEAQAPPQPEPADEPSRAPTADEGVTQDSPEAGVPIEEPAQVDAPLEAGPIEPGPSPEVPAPSDQVVAAPDPQPDPPPVTAQEPRADEASEESPPLELPGAGAIDEDILADPPDPEPVPEAYGIAPSTFDPDPPADPMEWDDRDPDPAETTSLPYTGAEDLAETEIEPEAESAIETETEQNLPPAPEQAWAGDPGLMPAASGPLSAPVEASPGPDPAGESSRDGVTGNRAFRVRLAPRPGSARIPAPLSGPGVSRLARNLRPGRDRGRRVLARPGSGANPRPRAITRRNPGRPLRISRGLHSRSPPSRS